MSGATDEARAGNADEAGAAEEAATVAGKADAAAAVGNAEEETGKADAVADADLADATLRVAFVGVSMASGVSSPPNKALRTPAGASAVFCAGVSMGDREAKMLLSEEDEAIACFTGVTSVWTTGPRAPDDPNDSTRRGLRKLCGRTHCAQKK